MSARKPSPFFPLPQAPTVPAVHDADARLLQPRHEPSLVSSSLRASRKPGGSRSADITRKEWSLLGAVVVLACFVRLYKISEPTSVVFDEVHFGGFASKYIRRTFFMDVHPPLAKLLITLAAWLGGYKGGPEDFKDIAKEYTSEVPYVSMRLLTSLLGVLLVPTTYLTLRALACTLTTSILGAFIVLFENALTAQSRLILLDSPLLFFTAGTVLCFVRFTNEDAKRPFTKPWWRWLVASGTMLGCVASCKWVGLFTIATLGLATIGQLWTLLGDLRVSPRLWLRHFAARAFGLIVIPVLVYMFIFKIHFIVLDSSGDGDGFMSSEFQHTLHGHGMEDTYAEVAYGSTISIRHLNTQGGYLHSHAHNYPTGSQQQQITLYPHRDTNNEWVVLNTTAEGVPDPDWDQVEPMQFITEGAQIRLQHKITQKRLHSHDVRPPISEVDFQNEISGYGFDGFAGDANDIFVVELSHGQDRKSRKALRALRSHFRLRHYLTGCYLFSHKVKLPEWGFEQQEVTCNKNPTIDNALWYVETNTHPKLPEKSEKVNYKVPGFLSKFAELNAVMWRTNAGLTDRHAYDSRPGSWPFMRRGINFWVKNNRQIYLIGNPVVWWAATTAVFLYVAVRGLIILRAKRGFRDLHHPLVVAYDPILSFLLLAWALHYAPFFLMERQLFLHHYLPALYFSVLLLCVVFDLSVSRLKSRTRIVVAGVVLLAVLAGFSHFSSLTYGRPWTRAQCESSKWRKTWDFSCADFHEEITKYGEVTPTPLFVSEPIASGNIEDGFQPITTDLPAAPLEPGHDVFAPQEPIPAEQAAANAALGNDELLPAHGGADDLATGLVAEEGDTPEPTQVVESVAMKQVVPPEVKIGELKGEERKAVEGLVEDALREDEREVEREV